MSQRVCANLSVSLDGIAAGHHQTKERPFGNQIGERMDVWMFERTADHQAEVDAIVDAGAFVMGRNMFGPDRGDWDLDWKGWWGDDPPYHAPVFVLAHRERAPIETEGGTTFHFVTDGIESALARAREAAGDRDVAVMGGATTINQYLRAGLIDELSLHILPITVGDGVRIFDGVGEIELKPVSSRTTPEVTHVTWRR
ncbi:dihydrofolate reductase family protein [Luteipulveratus halotolerans]|uniref:Bacterial bifunctional deaminase-reductase C-terminal domain-containing protein n=1 Tax=Luteipulveratus halotolerans TaxID=1631356 RepID=A0A0L6CMG4_9MICO|nr:dihydrofolate reductase family protein [Luteipulveratus halotolerans]KNX38840.1 hypothetical protein VV01_19600 [Luteipulveratus halotolerans]